jgi:HTH-type transcriptional regulator / antitoxin HigA
MIRQTTNDKSVDKSFTADIPMLRPGEFLNQILQLRQITQSSFAQKLGRTPQYVNDLIKGKKGFDPEVALELEAILDVPAIQWLQYELAYKRSQLVTSSQSNPNQVNSRKQLFEKHSFLADALKAKWIQDANDSEVLAQNVHQFLSKQAEVSGAFRYSENLNVDLENLKAWHTQVWIEADRLVVPTYDKARFPEMIEKLKKLTIEEREAGKVTALLRSYGIRFVIVSHIKKCPVDGVAFYDNGRPYLGISLRHGKLDQFWFVLMHELAHIFYEHEGHAPDNVDSKDVASPNEAQANQQAQRWLIPDQAYQAFIWRRQFTLAAIERFAASVEVHRSIVIGRLKTDGLVPWPKHAREHPSVREYLE